MTTTAPAARTGRRIATDSGTSPGWWFLDTLAVLRNPADGPAAPIVLELTVPPGGSPPRHVHQGLNDAFYLLEGEVVRGTTSGQAPCCDDSDVVVHRELVPHRWSVWRGGGTPS
jgi:hypothetical protein